MKYIEVDRNLKHVNCNERTSKYLKSNSLNCVQERFLLVIFKYTSFLFSSLFSPLKNNFLSKLALWLIFSLLLLLWKTMKSFQMLMKGNSLLEEIWRMHLDKTHFFLKREGKTDNINIYIGIYLYICPWHE